ncbi:PREDICTED: uncharacterized protein LOC107350108 isoform X2 [Acropora digitifera]|uniref:uncharacterized protein LOC107350108 isoform X2 n=1 Tax=Acropora digitifera TaxID=70779 RepID=UPI00077AACD7|nr:PREDICTED: uncharacterized protein LOC107350108 isoform X2 [Acropora digitifera]
MSLREPGEETSKPYPRRPVAYILSPKLKRSILKDMSRELHLRLRALQAVKKQRCDTNIRTGTQGKQPATKTTRQDSLFTGKDSEFAMRFKTCVEPTQSGIFYAVFTHNSVVVKLLRAEYNRRAQLRPLFWVNTIQLPLEKVYTRLKIVLRQRGGNQGETERWSDVIWAEDSRRDEIWTEARANKVNPCDVFRMLKEIRTS